MARSPSASLILETRNGGTERSLDLTSTGTMYDIPSIVSSQGVCTLYGLLDSLAQKSCQLGRIV